ncbi:MAG TPA: isoaspartyl peptidase/L-asparaginase [Bacteroidales bacterium]
MKKVLLLTSLAFLLVWCPAVAQQGRVEYAIVIHGGAGNILKESMPAPIEKMYRDSLEKALRIGDSILRNGGSSLDAVEACIRMLEDCPLFNAGKGAVFNAEGKNELDASIMNGNNHMAGSVAGITTVRHPISAARAVMEKSPHVMLTGKGAEQFAADQSLELVDPSWFFTQQRWDDYLKVRAHADSIAAAGEHGTVGCVALDKYGNLAAGTSTGGMLMKKYGRVGDSPIIGAGTYADNESCAVSATGHGEYFIRNVVAYDISALMKYKGMTLQEAASFVINRKLKEQGGMGGVICLDRNGNLAMPFNTAGMFRGWLKSEGGNLEQGVEMFR